MGISGGPYIVRDSSLVLELDAADKNSYPGSGTVWSDLSGNNNTGSLINTPTFSNINGGSFLFNGTNQSVSLVSLNLLQNFTLETWINQNVLNGFAIFGQGTQATNNGLHVWYTANTTIRFGMFGNDTDFTVSTSTGNWYHIVITYNHSSPFTKSMYLNGVALSGTPQQTQAAYTGTGTFRLAAIYSTPTNYGNGYFAGTKTYSRILSATEITQNYNEQKSRFGL